VDFLVGDETAIEVKTSDNVADRDLRSLELLHQEMTLRHKIVVCTERTVRRVRDVDALPVLTFLERLWQGEYRRS
jgi:hypothetical protein